MESLTLSAKTRIIHASEYGDNTSKLDTVPETEPLCESQASRPAIHYIEEESPDCERSVVSSPSSFDDDDYGLKAEISSLNRCDTEFFDLVDDCQTKLLCLSDKRETEYFDSDETERLAITHKQSTDYFEIEDTDEISSERQIQNNPNWTKSPKRRRQFTRIGARSPVQDRCLKTSGNQMYSPYLQRICPTTMDSINQKVSLISKLSFIERLEYIHKIQRPLLLSDMQSFKAANQGAVFQDFVSWYPIESSDQVCLLNLSDSDTTFAALDAANEAAHILTATRELWYETWEIAKEVPADRQPPIFDGAQEIEKILHYFETMHPSHLLNQVLIVSLTNSKFILLSMAGVSLEIPCIKRAFGRLDVLTQEAVTKLNEVSIRDENTELDESNQLLLSPDIIALCEDVCDCISAIETLLSYTSSLEHNFPGIYDMIDSILVNSDKAISVDSNESRVALLGALEKQQYKKSPELQFSEKKNILLDTSQREYIFRTLRGKAPCRLYANINEKSIEHFRNEMEDSILLAFVKSYTE